MRIFGSLGGRPRNDGEKERSEVEATMIKEEPPMGADVGRVSFFLSKNLRKKTKKQHYLY